MTRLDDLLQAHRQLTAVHVERWVRLGLLRPAGVDDDWTFEAVDVARVRLLAELSADLGFDEESLGTVVDLVDQVHTLRRQLALLGHAISEQPPQVREAIADALKRRNRK